MLSECSPLRPRCAEGNNQSSWVRRLRIACRWARRLGLKSTTRNSLFLVSPSRPMTTCSALKSRSAQDNGIASPILAPEKHRKRTKSQNSQWFAVSFLALPHSNSNCSEVKSCLFLRGTLYHLIRRAGDYTIHPSSIAERSTLRRVVRLRFSVRGETPVSFLRINPSWIILGVILFRRVSPNCFPQKLM